MYRVSIQGVDERMNNVHYYCKLDFHINYRHFLICCVSASPLYSDWFFNEFSVFGLSTSIEWPVPA